MQDELIHLLRCPRTRERLELKEPECQDGRIRSGWLVAESGRTKYPIKDFVPRFVPLSNYADTFGMQWNRFRQTQLDSCSGYPISANRFWKATAWEPRELAGKWVLDVGCGAGRFAEVALRAGAQVVALDYSKAVDACYENLKHHRCIHVVQGDVYALPFVNGAFPFVYSLGVLQHTPDVARAFSALPPMVQANGKLCIDFYERSWKSRLLPKYWLRPITKRLPPQQLLRALQVVVPRLLPLSQWIGRVPNGHVLKRILPVADPIYFYEKAYGKTQMTFELRALWSLLDTFDWLSPKYDNPQTPATIRQWMVAAHIQSIEVLKAGHLVARGVVGSGGAHAERATAELAATMTGGE